MLKSRCLGALLFAGLGLGFNSIALPQTPYPAKPVRMLVGLAAGGGTDLVARIIAPKLADALGQPFVVENRVGAGGSIAAEFVARSAPDGYTLLFAPNGPMVINPTMFKQMPFSPVRDFTPVALAVTIPPLIAVNAGVPARSIAELIDFLKKNVGKSNCGGAGPTFELAARLFTGKTGTECTFVQYKGSNETAQALMSGDLQFAVIDTGPVFPAIQSGKVRGLAVTGPTRDPIFPDLPSVAEAGFPELEMRWWMGVFAPTGTPAAIVKRLESEMLRVLKQPEVVKQLRNRQTMPANMGSEELARFLTSEIARWDAVRKGANIPQLD